MYFCENPKANLEFYKYQNKNEVIFHLKNFIYEGKEYSYDRKQLPTPLLIFKQTVENPKKYVLEKIFCQYEFFAWVPFLPKEIKETINNKSIKEAQDLKDFLSKVFKVNKTFIEFS